MKQLSLDFDNVGGLSACYAIPPTCISSIQIDYTTGFHSIVFSGTDDVIKIPILADESFSFSEPHGRDENGDWWQPTVTGVIPRQNMSNANDIDILERGEWIVAVKDQNGLLRLCGDLSTPLTFSTQADSGSAHSDRNQTAFTLTGKLGHSSYILSADVE